MTRAPFIAIEGKAYRWKDILELRRAQLTAAYADPRRTTGLIRRLARGSPPCGRAPGIRTLPATDPL